MTCRRGEDEELIYSGPSREKAAIILRSKTYSYLGVVFGDLRLCRECGKGLFCVLGVKKE